MILDGQILDSTVYLYYLTIEHSHRFHIVGIPDYFLKKQAAALPLYCSTKFNKIYSHRCGGNIVASSLQDKYMTYTENRPMWAVRVMALFALNTICCKCRFGYCAENMFDFIVGYDEFSRNSNQAIDRTSVL